MTMIAMIVCTLSLSLRVYADTSDTTPPEVSSTLAAGNKILLIYNEPLSAASIPQPSSFPVIYGGAVWVTGVSISGSTVVLTLSQSVTIGSILLNYSAGTTPIKDLAGNAAPAFTSKTVFIAGTSHLESASITGSTITLTFNAALNDTAKPSPTQFLVKLDGVVTKVTDVAISGTRVSISLDSVSDWGQVVTVGYYPSSTFLKDMQDRQIVPFTDYPVTNTSSSGIVLPGYLESDSGAGFRLTGQSYFKGLSNTPSGKIASLFMLDETKLADAFQLLKPLAAKVKKPEISFIVPSTELAGLVRVPGKALEAALSANSNSVFRLDYNDSQFRVPLSGLNLTREAQQWGVPVSSISLDVSIEKNAVSSAFSSAVYSKGYGMLTMPAYFKAVLSAGAKQKEADYSTYIDRAFVLPPGYSTYADQLLVVRYDAATGEIAFVPSFVSAAANGSAVHFLSRANGEFAVVSAKSSYYGDVNNHWARNDILLLTSKLIVDGTAIGSFSPDQNITRADFAKFIVNGMSIPGDKDAAAKFKDVSVSSATAAYIGAASKAGIVSGGTDGNFRPNATVTREEMASMFLRAMNYAGVQSFGSQASLAKFNDGGKISSFAKSAVAACVDAGILTGVTSTKFSPQENATRAQAASMIKRFLNYVEFLP